MKEEWTRVSSKSSTRHLRCACSERTGASSAFSASNDRAACTHRSPRGVSLLPPLGDPYVDTDQRGPLAEDDGGHACGREVVDGLLLLVARLDARKQPRKHIAASSSSLGCVRPPPRPVRRRMWPL
jgi:hypothetical protein